MRRIGKFCQFVGVDPEEIFETIMTGFDSYHERESRRDDLTREDPATFPRKRQETEILVRAYLDAFFKPLPAQKTEAVTN